MTARVATLASVPRVTSASLPLLPFLPLLALPFVGTEPETIDRVIVAIECVLLVMGVRSPVWLLGALVLSELTVRNYFIVLGHIENLGEIKMSTRLFISLVASVIVLPHLGSDLGPKSKPMLRMMAAFIAITTLANAVAADVSYTAQFFRYILTGFIAMVLVPLALRSRDDVVQIGLVGLVVGTLSAFVAIMQHYHFRGAPIIATVPNSVFDTGFDAWQGRALGLAEHPVYLTNDLLLILLPIVAILLTGAASVRARPYLLLVSVVLLGGLYFTQTRSWVVAAVPALVAMGVLLAPRMRRDVLALLLLLVVAFGAWSAHAQSRYSLGPSEDDSAAARPVLWSASFNIAKDYPILGVGHNEFLELSPAYASTTASPDANDVLGRFTPHNDYLNVWLSFGTAALAVYLAITVYTFLAFKEAYQRLRDPMLRAIALGGLGALVAFSFNSFFHNFFDSTLTLWLLAGLSLALTQLAAQERAPLEAAA